MRACRLQEARAAHPPRLVGGRQQDASLAGGGKPECARLSRVLVELRPTHIKPGPPHYLYSASIRRGHAWLAKLQAGADRMEVRYVERGDGAEVHFTSQDRTLVAALHDWFDAQVSDHGEYAEHS